MAVAHPMPSIYMTAQRLPLFSTGLTSRPVKSNPEFRIRIAEIRRTVFTKGGYVDYAGPGSVDIPSVGAVR